MVRPVLEYCSTVWDPHLPKDINEFKKEQTKAVRWTMSNYNWSSSVTSMLELLPWHTLTTCRHISRLHMFINLIITIL